MSLRTKRFLFFFFWALSLLFVPITVFRNTAPASAFSDPLSLMSVFQRITGLFSFTLVFIQVVLGSWMLKWVQVIGARAYKLHITQGVVTYAFLFIHPLFENAIVYQASKSLINALLVFLPKFQTQRDILIVLGRSAFILATVAIAAAYFRTKPFFRRNWRAFHILNYLVYYLVFFHARIGTDTTTAPFAWVYWGSLPLVTATLVGNFVFPSLKRFVQKTQELAPKS